MSIHVDVIRNEWTSGYQVLKGRLLVEDDDILVKDAQSPEWLDQLSVALVDAEKNVGTADPVRVLQEVHERIQGTYVFATEPHNDEQCAFRQSALLPMVPIAPQRPAGRSRRRPRSGRLNA